MIAAYLRERLRPRLFVPVAAAVTIAASAAQFDPAGLARDFGFALLLLAEFRLWDDLADRRVDAVAHPRRVLVRVASIRPFMLLCVALAVTNLAVCVASGSRAPLLTLLGLHAALGTWYGVRWRRTILGDQLLLAKYPAFVVIVAGARAVQAPLPIGAAALLVYAAASLYEGWHDPASPVSTLLGGRS